MHNVNLTKLEQTIDKARNDPQAMRQPVNLDGQWQTEHGAPQFRGTISYPSGEVEFACDFPPPMGGSGAAPNPLAYCLWGGIACYAMTYATEAARDGIPLAALRGTITTKVDQTRALGVTDNPPVEQVTWSLQVQADASDEALHQIKIRADERCPGVYCMRNPIDLTTTLDTR
jgi:uncharacterized OsmC-like protein